MEMRFFAIILRQGTLEALRRHNIYPGVITTNGSDSSYIGAYLSRHYVPPAASVTLMRHRGKSPTRVISSIPQPVLKAEKVRDKNGREIKNSAQRAMETGLLAASKPRG